MQKFLVVVGCQEDKLDCISKSDKNRILDYISSHQHIYDGTLAIVRGNVHGNRNFKKKGDTIGANGMHLLDFSADDIIEVSGYDIDCKLFRRDVEYHIIGISTAASVLCCALSMYSAGFEVKVLSKYCADRKGMHDKAIQIMKAYMEGCVV